VNFAAFLAGKGGAAPKEDESSPASEFESLAGAADTQMPALADRDEAAPDFSMFQERSPSPPPREKAATRRPSPPAATPDFSQPDDESPAREQPGGHGDADSGADDSSDAPPPAFESDEDLDALKPPPTDIPGPAQNEENASTEQPHDSDKTKVESAAEEIKDEDIAATADTFTPSSGSSSIFDDEELLDEDIESAIPVHETDEISAEQDDKPVDMASAVDSTVDFAPQEKIDEETSDPPPQAAADDQIQAPGADSIDDAGPLAFHDDEDRAESTVATEVDDDQHEDNAPPAAEQELDDQTAASAAADKYLQDEEDDQQDAVLRFPRTQADESGSASEDSNAVFSFPDAAAADDASPESESGAALAALSEGVLDDNPDSHEDPDSDDLSQVFGRELNDAEVAIFATLRDLNVAHESLHLAPEIPSKKLENATRRYARVGGDELIYCLQDSTMLKSGDAGFVLTSRGVYWNSTRGRGRGRLGYGQIDTAGVDAHFDASMLGERSITLAGAQKMYLGGVDQTTLNGLAAFFRQAAELAAEHSLPPLPTSDEEDPAAGVSSAAAAPASPLGAARGGQDGGSASLARERFAPAGPVSEQVALLREIRDLLKSMAATQHVRQLKELLDSGGLTQEEFDAQKRAALGEQDESATNDSESNEDDA